MAADNVLEVQIRAITTQLDAALKSATGKLDTFTKKSQKAGEQMEKVGKQLSMKLTLPLLALGGVAVANFDKQAKAIAQLEAGLRSTGNAVGYTSKELQRMASDLQKTTLFGDEEILQGVTNQLLTFTNIANEQFARTQKAALDLATRLGGDLQGASIQLGKALNDPVANLSALSRSGIQFSEQQKALIKSLVETNRLADAQTVILDELEKQYGGSAEAAAKAGAGPLKQLSMAIGDLSESFGKIILEYINPFIEKLKKFTDGLQNSSETTKKLIVIVGGLAAVLGPLLVTVGFFATTVLPGLVTTMTFLSTTLIPSLTAGFGALNAVILANPLVALTTLIVGTTAAFVTFVQSITPAVSKLQTFFNLIASGGNSFVFTNKQIKDQVANTKEIKKETAKANLELEKFAGWLDQTAKFGSSKLPQNIKPEEEDPFKNIKKNTAEYFELQKSLFQEEQKSQATSYASWLDYERKITEVSNRLYKLQTGFKGATQVVPIPTQTAGLTAIQTKDDPINQVSSITNRIGEETVKMQEALYNFDAAAKDIIGSSIVGTFEGLGYAIGDALANGGNVLKAAGQVIIASLGSVLQQFGSLIVAAGFASEAFSKMMKNPFGGGLGAIAAGTALIAIGGAIKAFSNKASSTYDGGSSGGSFGGYNSNYSGSTTSSTSGIVSNDGTVVFEIAGTKLVGVLNRTLQRNASLGGQLKLT